MWCACRPDTKLRSRWIRCLSGTKMPENLCPVISIHSKSTQAGNRHSQRRLTAICFKYASAWHVLPYLGSLQSSSLLCSERCQLQAHWESLGEKKRRKKKRCHPQSYQTCKHMMDTKPGRQTDISTGNSISPKSMKSSTSCLSLVHETSCQISCCRFVLPDAQCVSGVHNCHQNLTHYLLNRSDFFLSS